MTDSEVMGRVLSDLRFVAGMLLIRTKSSGLRPFRYDLWNEEQRRFHRERTGRDIVLKPRQIGFSTLELARGYWLSTTREGFNTTVVGHDKDLVEALFMTVKLFHESLKRQGLAPATRYDNVRELTFSELASSIAVTEAGATKAVASNKGRSGTINRLHATEVAFWRVPEETMAGLLGAVPEDGEVLIESTPNGAGGYFYDLVQQAASGRGPYRLHFYPWHEHKMYRLGIGIPDVADRKPRDEWEERLRSMGIDDHQLAWWRKQVERLGIDKALQEYPIDLQTCFRSAGRMYLEPSTVDAAATRIKQPVRTVRLRGLDVRIYQEPSQTGDYIIGADTAEGIGNDASTCTVLERKTGHTVAVGWSDSIAPGDFGLALVELAKMYRSALIAPERNNHGTATLRAIEAEAMYPRVYEHGDKRRGWLTNLASRPPLWEELRMAVAEGSAWTPDSQMVAEMRTLIIDDDGKPRAMAKGSPHGARDDLWVSWAIAWQVRGKPVVHMPVLTGRTRITHGLGKYY